MSPASTALFAVLVAIGGVALILHLREVIRSEDDQ